MKKYKQNDRDKLNKRQREYRKKHKKYKLADNVAKIIRNSLKSKKKGRHWEDLVGYNLDKLLQRLEVNFKPNMSWDNYGEWHIDHKKPVSWFNFNSYEDQEFKNCWILCNLQPLWAEENTSKGNRFKG